MGSLRTRVEHLEAAAAGAEDFSALTETELDDRIEAELDRLIDSVHGAHTRHLLTQGEVNELKNAYAQSSITGQDASELMTPELTAALEGIKR